MASTSAEKKSSPGGIPDCTACEDSKTRAVARCSDCNDYLCETCLESHKRLRALKKHRVQPITLCSSCEETGKKSMAIVRCVQCNDTMCPFCLEAHRRLRALKDHQVVNLEQHQSQKQNHDDQKQQQPQQQQKSAPVGRSRSQRGSTSSSKSSSSNGVSRKQSTEQAFNNIMLRKASEFGREGEVRVLAARGIAIHPNGSVVIVDCQGLKLFTNSGKIRFYFNMQQGFPNVKSQLSDVTITREGLIIVADETPQLKVFNQDGRFVREFVTITPDGKSSAQINSRLVSVLVDHKGQILVGSGSEPYYISIHRAAENGNHIATIKTNIEPRCMAVSPLNSNIVIGCWSDAKVHILNKAGEVQRTVAEPKHMKWLPVGLCYTEDNNILISNVGSPGIGIYRFDSSGTFLGCVTEDVKYPWGIALKKQEVVIADTECIKIFQWS